MNEAPEQYVPAPLLFQTSFLVYKKAILFQHQKVYYPENGT
jgi:hypothetical protein